MYPVKIRTRGDLVKKIWGDLHKNTVFSPHKKHYNRVENYFAVQKTRRILKVF